jgi:hypothetical protein
VLHVSTPQPRTYYPSTTRGMCVGPPVAVNIDFGRYIWFLNNSFVWIVWVQQYATDLSGQQLEFIGQCWYFNPQWTLLQAIIKACGVSTLLVGWEKCAVTLCLHIYQFLWRGLGGRGVHSGYGMEAWPSRVLQHIKRQQFTKWEWTKFLQTSTHCLWHLCKLFGI